MQNIMKKTFPDSANVGIFSFVNTTDKKGDRVVGLNMMAKTLPEEQPPEGEYPSDFLQMMEGAKSMMDNRMREAQYLVTLMEVQRNLFRGNQPQLRALTHYCSCYGINRILL